MPAMPVELSVSAAAAPATMVPWPSLSVTSLPPVMTLYPARTFPPERSSWAAFIPESMKAMVTPELPLVTSQAE